MHEAPAERTKVPVSHVAMVVLHQIIVTVVRWSSAEWNLFWLWLMSRGDYRIYISVCDSLNPFQMSLVAAVQTDPMVSVMYDTQCKTIQNDCKGLITI